MEWRELDFDRATWVIPAARSKNKRQHILPLSPEAVEIIKALPRFSGSKFVFSPGERAPSGYSRAKTRAYHSAQQRRVYIAMDLARHQEKRRQRARRAWCQSAGYRKASQSCLGQLRRNCRHISEIQLRRRNLRRDGKVGPARQGKYHGIQADRLMVTKRTWRDRGRPNEAVPFLQDPNRNLVMILRATMEVMPPPPSIRRASKVVAKFVAGNEVDPKSLSPEGRKIVANCPPGMITLISGPDGPVVHKADGSVSYKNTKRGAKAATIEGAAESSRS
jgi:hypothetical protein